jgi:hypothetical protein
MKITSGESEVMTLTPLISAQLDCDSGFFDSASRQLLMRQRFRWRTDLFGCARLKAPQPEI